MAGKKGFEGFEAIFGEAKAEPEREAAAATLRPFLFYVHALDSSRLELIASDFHSLTWERILTVDLLEDLRDDIGIGGSWSEFVDYLIASLSSGDVKLILGSLSNLTIDSGVAHAKLIAHKSKGLPRISLSHNKLTNSSASDAMAKFSLALFKAFKDEHNFAIKEHERLLQMKGILSSEKERSENLQQQLDSLSFLSRRKTPRSKASEKATPVFDSISDCKTMVASDMHEPSASYTANSEMQSVKDAQPMKVSLRAAPAPVSRRAKVRGVSLQDPEDDHDN